MNPFVIFEWLSSSLPKCHSIKVRLIDAIIFGTNCVKTQDKLLQMPKTLSLQQCLTVCHHYESLKIHIQQIRPDRHVKFLRKHHPKKKQGPKLNPVTQVRSQSRRNQMANTQTVQSPQSQSQNKSYRKYYG